MASNTFTLISSVTVGSGGASSIDFTSIPSTYTDLLLKVSARNNTSGAATDQLWISFNGSTSSFSNKILYGTGSAASSTSIARYVGALDNPDYTASTFNNAEIYIPNYAGSNYKSVSADGVNENNATGVITALAATLWSNTAAINQVTLTANGGSFVQYSTAYLYGIKNS